MDIGLLTRRASRAEVPCYQGEWATIFFRPDLASQQEFLVGACACAIDHPLIVSFIPSVTRLSKLYGSSLDSNDVRSLFHGAELAITRSFKGSLKRCDTGSPQLRLQPCGYLAASDLEVELLEILKRQASGLWAEPNTRDALMNDEWAYGVMQKCLATMREIFIPGREIQIGQRIVRVGLQSSTSFGDIVSARYSVYETVERHVKDAVIQLTIARTLSDKKNPPALFVVLPEESHTADDGIALKTRRLLEQCRDMDIQTFGNANPVELSRDLADWAQHA